MDVFTGTPFQGNALAVVLDGSGLGRDEMQAIANEFNLPETTFVTDVGPSRYEMRIFTPVTEIPIAGHPSIGTAFTLFEEGLLKRRGEVTRVDQRTAVGVSPMEVFSRRARRAERIMMTQKRPVYRETFTDLGRLAAALKVENDELGPEGLMPQVVYTGLAHLIVPARSLSTLPRVAPDFEAVKSIERELEITGVGVFARAGPGEFRFRFFAPSIGITEDPAAGSAAGALGAYVYSYAEKTKDETVYTVVQGIELNRRSEILVRVGATRGGPRVAVGGRAVSIAEGSISR